MGVRPQWEWVFVAADDQRPDRPVGPVFTGRFDAEQWIGEHWRALVEQGVVRAQLQHSGQPVGAALELPVEG
jgi:hypothetical protein